MTVKISQYYSLQGNSYKHVILFSFKIMLMTRKNASLKNLIASLSFLV